MGEVVEDPSPTAGVRLVYLSWCQLADWTPSVIGQRFSRILGHDHRGLHASVRSYRSKEGAALWVKRSWVRMLQAQKRDWNRKVSDAVILAHTVPRLTTGRELDGSWSPQYGRCKANGVPVLHIRCMTTARRRASATLALRMPRRRATLSAQLFSQLSLRHRVNMTLAAS